VAVLPLIPNSSIQQFNVESLAEGVYFWQLDAERGIKKTGRFIVLRD
jgi:hypothetical protein